MQRTGNVLNMFINDTGTVINIKEIRCDVCGLYFWVSVETVVSIRCPYCCDEE